MRVKKRFRQEIDEDDMSVYSLGVREGLLEDDELS